MNTVEGGTIEMAEARCQLPNLTSLVQASIELMGLLFEGFGGRFLAKRAPIILLLTIEEANTLWESGNDGDGSLVMSINAAVLRAEIH